MHLCAAFLEVVAMVQKFRHKKALARASGARDLARIFAAAVAVSIVIAALILMIYWIQSMLEFPKHLLAAILSLLRGVPSLL